MRAMHRAGTVGAPVGAIRDALSYLARFRGRLFVIKIDDRVLESPLAAVLVHDIVLMRRMGIQAVVVAGARAAIERSLRRAALPSRYHRGLRVTTEPMMEHVIHAVSELSTRLMSLFSECGGHAASGNWVRARSLGVVDGVDYDRSGRAERVDTALMRALIDREVVPIVTTIGWNAVGTAYNLASDDLAVAVAAGLQAAKLFVAASSPGILAPGRAGRPGRESGPPGAQPLRDSGAYATMTVDEAADLAAERDSGLDADAQVMLRLAIDACRRGVERVHVIDGTRDGVLLEEIFSAGGSGTMIYANRFADFGAATPEDVPAIMSLLQPLVTGGLLVPRSPELIGAAIDDWVVYRVDDTIQGCSGLDDLGGGDVEIVGLAVNPPHRAANVGGRLVELLLRRARERGARRVFVLTTQAIDFFRELGFRNAEVAALPAARRSLYDPQRGSRILMIDPRQTA